MSSQKTSRRGFMSEGCGFGALAASAMLLDQAQASESISQPARLITPHHAPRAKRVIFLFMQGGVSQVDSFDYKPQLAKRNGDELTFDDARQLAKTGKRTNHRLMQSPWKFRPYGETGKMVSDLFPETAKHVDKLTFLHGMHTEGVAHGPATLFLHCGSTNFIRPSFGSWVFYGLGTENSSLPGFVSISPSVGNGGPRNYGSAFLPPTFQGTKIGTPSGKLLIDNLTSEQETAVQTKQHNLLQAINQRQLDRRNIVSGELRAAADSVDLAWQMQQVGPDMMDLTSESEATKRMYGMDEKATRDFGSKCLLARRLCEAGVRFIQVNYGDNSANPSVGPAFQLTETRKPRSGC